MFSSLATSEQALRRSKKATFHVHEHCMRFVHPMLVGKDMRCTSMKSISIIFSKFRISTSWTSMLQNYDSIMRSTSTQWFLFNGSSSNLSTSALIWENVIDPSVTTNIDARQFNWHASTSPNLKLNLINLFFGEAYSICWWWSATPCLTPWNFPRHQVDLFVFGVWMDPMHFCSKWHNHHESCNASQKCRRFQGEQGLALCQHHLQRKLETTETWSILTAKTSKGFWHNLAPPLGSPRKLWHRPHCSYCMPSRCVSRHISIIWGWKKGRGREVWIADSHRLGHFWRASWILFPLESRHLRSSCAKKTVDDRCLDESRNFLHGHWDVCWCWCCWKYP